MTKKKEPIWYKVNAGYRPENKETLFYYGKARTKKEAKELFGHVFSWLKIYSVEPMTEQEIAEMYINPKKYIYWDNTHIQWDDESKGYKLFPDFYKWIKYE